MTDRELSNLEWRVVEEAVRARELSVEFYGAGSPMFAPVLGEAVDALIAARAEIEGRPEPATVKRYSGGFLS